MDKKFASKQVLFQIQVKYQVESNNIDDYRERPVTNIITLLQLQPVLLMLSNIILFYFLNSKKRSIIKFLPGKNTSFKMLFTTWIQDATPIAALTAATKRLLLHQCLGHPSD